MLFPGRSDYMKPIRIAHLGVAHDHSGLTLETVRKFPEEFTVVSLTENHVQLDR